MSLFLYIVFLIKCISKILQGVFAWVRLECLKTIVRWRKRCCSVSVTCISHMLKCISKIWRVEVFENNSDGARGVAYCDA